MLNHLSIRNFAIVKSLDIDFASGMTAITGETGAGKSIAIDALGLCLGDRAEAGMVRVGADKAEIAASFDIASLPQAANWLKEHDLDDDTECLIRRVISAEGRSKAYINGIPVPLQQLKGLGEFLVSIHGQHAHQQLLKSDMQRLLVDDFAEHRPLLDEVSRCYQHLQQSKKRLKDLQASRQQREDRRQLLEYQVVELNDFALDQDEFAELEIEHKKLSHSQTLLEQTQLSFYQLYESDEFNALAVVQQCVERLTELQEHDAVLAPIAQMLSEASIQIDEASQELRAYTERLEIDPMRMQQIDARYSAALELARKHQVRAESLYAHHQQLAEEFNALRQDDDLFESLQVELLHLEQNYLQAAVKLSTSRAKAAKRLAQQVQSEIRKMNMLEAVFEIDVVFEEQHSVQITGLDQVCFKVSSNPGQPVDAMEKVISGGELSRIGLAIQVISSSSNQIPTMIFDEVDTGISGPTASVVGRLLRKLGETTQVMCVTHLPQVAARGHHQMLVTKYTDKQTTETHMLCLDENERIDELARLLAGDKLTESAIANARELLNSH
jgi:DNA repair protein RecN (Recombination protein N)